MLQYLHFIDEKNRVSEEPGLHPGYATVTAEQGLQHRVPVLDPVTWSSTEGGLNLTL